MSKTFSLGRWFDFEFRIHWSVFIYFLFALQGYSRAFSTPGQPMDGRYAVLALLGVLLLFAIVSVHELGHAFAARRRGIEVHSISLSPIGGAAWMGRSRSPEDELIVTLWGPAVHPVMILLSIGPYFMSQEGTLDLGFYGNQLLYQFFWLNIILLGFNLLPSFPMDGGRILRALLSQRMNPSRATIIAATIGKVASVLFILGGIFWVAEYWLIWIMIGISNFMVCQQELMLAREENPYGQPTFAYGGFEGAYGGYSATDETDDEREPRRGPIRRFLDARAERARVREAIDEAELKANVDDLLRKVSEVGMDGLTDEERRFLEKASDRYRKS